MKSKILQKVIRGIAGAIAAAIVFTACLPALAAGRAETARPSVIGRLRVVGGQLSDEAGKAVQLRGVSTHGLTRYPDYLIMSLFLVDGRDGDGEAVKVVDAEFVTLKTDERIYEGVTTLMTEHGMTVFLDEGQDLKLGTPVEITVAGSEATVTAAGTVVGVRESRSGAARTHTLEILDFCGNETAYWQILYDRVPTLPQSLHRDFGVISHLWQNIAHRVARTGKH